ncbi:GNAT family N-acetyltransferase [Parageobacillus thermoglucosidasius]|uniref:Acetyltransferase n=1 Tax=Parageobacillus thermoglucosidasius TaxID=1426 RepID=A0A1B7KMU7_PARTM|nr:GNAT family N-acetyltransferase [Parageobacillus thermoglucosidasius]OAT71309.1 acetyltransferase [Parageobacillus thermoglucosidasius]
MSKSDFFKYDFFKNINLSDPFFDSLKEDYKEFEEWFRKKADDKAYYYEDENGIQAFLYLKIEDEALTDITPPLPKNKRIKIGTLKINPHGTRLGERFIKKALDYAVVNDIKEVYVTIFEKHKPLIELLKKYGFEHVAWKTTDNGTESVMLKDLNKFTGDILKDYPLVSIGNTTPYLLSIYPEYHTKLFPDSILHNESGYDLIKDISHTNSIEKVYICGMDGVVDMKPGDPIVIYRTTDIPNRAEYRSVATSICVLKELKTKNDFDSLDSFLKYCSKYSVFSQHELKRFFSKKKLYVLRMTYNLALSKRLIRKKLIEQCGLDRNLRWSIMRLTEQQFERIIKLGGVNESFIINQTRVRR